MFALWTFALVATLYLIMRYMTRKKYNLPPGPPGQLLVGNLLQLNADAPHKTMTKWSEKYGDVYSINLLGRTSVILSSYETIYEGMVRQANAYAGRSGFNRLKMIFDHCPDIVTSTFSQKWVYTKKMAMQTLKMYSDNLYTLEKITMELVADMVNELEMVAEKGPIDMYAIYHRCTTGIISSILYGYKIDRHKIDIILKATNSMTVLLMPTGTGVILDIMPWVQILPIKLKKQLNELRDVIKHTIGMELTQRKLDREPGNPHCVIDGLFDHQQNSQKEQSPMQLTDDDIYGVNLNLIFAGTLTTSTTLNCLLAVLVNKPDLQEHMAKVIESKIGRQRPCLADRSRLHYIEATILEILRYSSIVPMTAHATMVDTQMKGYDIPKGTEIMFNLWNLHHSDEYWDEPWEFKPERYLDENGELVPPDHINRKRLLAFGASRRVCIGETLAKNRLFLIVTSLIQHFKFLPAGPNECPRHDPRDYKLGIGIEPHRYRINIVPRK